MVGAEGAVTSTVKRTSVGVLVLFAGSVAVTDTRWKPSVKPRCVGSDQLPLALTGAATGGSPSTVTFTVLRGSAVPEKAVPSWPTTVSTVGVRMVGAAGGVRSTVKVVSAGRLVLSRASVAVAVTV